MLIAIFALTQICASCTSEDKEVTNPVVGFEILNDLSGHWVGQNETVFGFYEWFAFDFRPISASHVHSIYEGSTNQNIITSVFLADFNDSQQIMARNGGWLGNQYRATYFLLDRAENNESESYYRLVDAVGGEDRAYMEFRFTNDSIYFDAYKDDSGSLDKPVHHMGFSGINRNPSYSNQAENHFDYPQQISEVDLNGAFNNLIDSDSALFLEESADPFPKADHGYLGDLTIDIMRNNETQDHDLLLYISKEALVSPQGNVNFSNLDNSVIRTISIHSSENSYLTTYVHPDDYFLTIFSDLDNDGIPSPGDYTSPSVSTEIKPESLETETVEISILLM